MIKGLGLVKEMFSEQLERFNLNFNKPSVKSLPVYLREVYFRSGCSYLARVWHTSSLQFFFTLEEAFRYMPKEM